MSTNRNFAENFAFHHLIVIGNSTELRKANFYLRRSAQSRSSICPFLLLTKCIKDAQNICKPIEICHKGVIDHQEANDDIKIDH